MSVRGVPEQDKPENQDAAVAYYTDQMTGETKQLDGAPNMEPVKSTGPDLPVFTPAEAEAKKEFMNQGDTSAQQTKAEEPKKVTPKRVP